MYDTMTVVQCRLFGAELLSIYTHLFSRRNVWIIEFTVVLPTLAAPFDQPQPLWGRDWQHDPQLQPWFHRESAYVLGLFFLFPCFVPFPFLPAPSPLFHKADLPFLCHSIVEMVHTMSCLVHICLWSGGLWDSALSDCREVAYHWLQLMLHTPLLISESWGSPERNCSI